MNELHNNSAAQPAVSAPAGLPRRDYVRLPLISLAPILFIFGVSELLTRVIWAEHKEGSCTIVDPVGGDHFKPNCTIRTKNAEGPWTTYHYNECGYRSATSCGPKPVGAIRIAILGSSVSQALYVPYDQTYFARTASDLSRSCDRPIDVQNLGVPGSSPIYAYRRLPEVIAQHAGTVKVLHTLRPFAVAMAGHRELDPWMD